MQIFKKIYDCSVQIAGLKYYTEILFLAANPDGLINNNSVIKIKCSLSIKEYTNEESYHLNILKYIVLKYGKLVLKRNNNYYYQVQGQWHIIR